VKWLDAIGRRARGVLLLTGLSAWRGFLGFYHSDDLTYAASISYYALLSLFPFFLLALSILGSATTDEAKRSAVMLFVLRYFPTQFDFITRQLDSFRTSQLTVGVAGTIASDVQGSYAFETPTTLTGAGGEFPSAGEILIHGADDTSARITALDNTNVRLELDTDGDGEPDESSDTTWTDLTDGTISNPVNRDEFGNQQLDRPAWPDL